MTTQTLVGNQSYSYPSDGQNRFFTIENVIDFKTDLVDSLGTAYLTADDSCKVIKVPAGAFVLQVLVRLERKGTIGAETFTLGDAAGATTWMATANAIGTTGTNGTVFQAVYNDTRGPDNMLGYRYTADGYILMTVTTANSNAKITVSAICVKPFGKATG